MATFFGLVVKVFHLLLYCMSYCFELLELKRKRIKTYKNNNKYNDISGFRVIFDICVCAKGNNLSFVFIFFYHERRRSRLFWACFVGFIGPLACFSRDIWQHWSFTHHTLLQSRAAACRAVFMVVTYHCIVTKFHGKTKITRIHLLLLSDIRSLSVARSLQHSEYSVCYLFLFFFLFSSVN